MSFVKSTLAAVLIVLMQPGFADAETKIPRRIEFKYGGAPLWVAATEAFDAAGALRPGVLSDRHRDAIAARHRREMERRQRNAVPGEAEATACDANFYGSSHWGDRPAARSLRSLTDIAATRQLVTGIVRDSAVGFTAGVPATVLQIQRTDGRGEFVYILYPAGRVRVDDITVCNADPEFPPLPASGDRVAFVAGVARDPAETVFVPPASWMFFQHGQTLVVPHAMRSDPDLRDATSLDAVIQTLRCADPQSAKKP